MSDNREWWEKVDPSKLSEDTRYRILVRVVEKYERKRVREETGISRVTLWRLLERKSPDKPEYVKPLLKLLSREEFEKLVTARERLRSLGIVRDDGTIDYSLALEILAIAKDDEYLKNAILRFVVSEFREDLKRMLGISFADITLKWDESFEHFLADEEEEEEDATRKPSSTTVAYSRSTLEAGSCQKS